MTPRVYIDDVEANFRTDYKLANPNPRFSNYPTDPKAQRIRTREKFWKWLFINRSDFVEIKNLLEEVEKDFRKMYRISSRNQLNATQVQNFQTFEDSVSRVIGHIHELGTFIRVIHGNSAIQLIEGELETMNSFGNSIDPYIMYFTAIESIVTKRKSDFAAGRIL